MRFARFAVVGGGNTLVSFVSYAAYLAVGVPYVAAAVLAFAAGATNGYIVNRRWTFRADDTWHARGTYAAVQASALVLNTALVGMAVTLGTPRLVAYALAVPPVTVLSLLASRSLAFQRPRKRRSELVGPSPSIGNSS